MIDAIIVHLSSDNGLIELLILFLIEWNMCIGHWICLTVSWISCPNCYIIFLLNNCLRTIGLKMLTRDGTEILNVINNPPQLGSIFYKKESFLCCGYLDLKWTHNMGSCSFNNYATEPVNRLLYVSVFLLLI